MLHIGGRIPKEEWDNKIGRIVYSDYLDYLVVPEKWEDPLWVLHDIYEKNIWLINDLLLKQWAFDEIKQKLTELNNALLNHCISSWDKASFRSYFLCYAKLLKAYEWKAQKIQ